MTYWTIVCEQDTAPLVASLNKPGWDCQQANARILEVTLSVVPPAGSSYSGLWDLGNLSISDSEVILSGVLLLWAIAWGFRQIAKAVISSRGDDEE